MIQRIQTIYLAIALISVACCLFFPYGSYLHFDEEYTFNSIPFLFGKDSSTAIYAETICIYLSIILTALAIFNFKNRKRQQFINKLNFVIILFLIALMLAGFSRIKSKLNLVPEDISFEVGLFLPLIALVAIIMAYRAIKKDEDLIKSMDRIR